MSDSVWPHRWQPTTLPHLWDSPGKSTGVGCHFLLQCRKVKSESELAQLCPTLSDPTDCSPPGSSVHGIFQARVLEWVTFAFSRNPHNHSLKALFSPRIIQNIRGLCFFLHCCGWDLVVRMGFPGGSDGKESACNEGDWGSISLGRLRSWEDPLEKGMATHSSILAWNIPWTEEPGGLQSMRSQRVRHNWATNTFAGCQAMEFKLLLYNCSRFFELRLHQGWELIGVRGRGSHINKHRLTQVSWAGLPPGDRHGQRALWSESLETRGECGSLAVLDWLAAEGFFMSVLKRPCSSLIKRKQRQVWAF